jgi:anti-sigma factor RsiW
MLTLEHFEDLVSAYGADLNRWPESMRSEVQALLATSPNARALLAEAVELDQQLTQEAAHSAARGALGDPVRALAHLRSGVAARIDAQESRREGTTLYWFRLTAVGAAAVAAGLVLGSWYSAPAPRDGLLVVLQPLPFEVQIR